MLCKIYLGEGKMDKENFHQLIQDSQFFTSLEQIINFLESVGFYGDQEDIEYLLTGLKNTLKRGLDIK